MSENYAEFYSLPPEIREELTTKQCSRCLGRFPFSNFHKRKASKDGLNPACKGCSLRYTREGRKRREQEKLNQAKELARRSDRGYQGPKPSAPPQSVFEGLAFTRSSSE